MRGQGGSVGSCLGPDNASRVKSIRSLTCLSLELLIGRTEILHLPPKKAGGPGVTLSVDTPDKAAHRRHRA